MKTDFFTKSFSCFLFRICCSFNSQFKDTILPIIHLYRKYFFLFYIQISAVIRIIQTVFLDPRWIEHYVLLHRDRLLRRS